MKIATRKKLLAYAIPLDLVVVATGIGLVIPSISPIGLIAIFVAAVALSAWKSGWVGALAAMVLSSIALFALFSRAIHGEQIAWFVGAGVLVSFPLSALRARRRRADAPPESPAKPLDFAAATASPLSAEETAAAALRGEGLKVDRPENSRVTPVRRSVEEAAAAALLNRGLPVERVEHPKVAPVPRSAEETAAAALRDKGLPVEPPEHPKVVPVTRSVEETAAAALREKGLSIEPSERPKSALLTRSVEEIAAAVLPQGLHTAERPIRADPIKVDPAPPAPAPRPVPDEHQISEREARARAEGERIANERFAIEKKKLEDDFALAREQFEREQTERFERRRAEFQAGYDRDRMALKAKFDAARLELDAERAALQRQLDEERAKPAVVEEHPDEDAIAQRLEHLRAELQEQFERELQPRVDAALAAQRQALDRDAQREIEKARANADDRVATFRAELERVLAEKTAAPRSSRVRQVVPEQRGIFRGLFSRQTTNGESTASRRAAVAAVAESSAARRAKAASTGERKARILFLETRRATADTAAPRLRQLDIEVVIVERLIDAVDELYRFRPDVLFLDAELPDFENAYRTIAGQAKNLPLVLSSRNASSIPDIGRAGIAIRPYIIDEVVDLARAAVNDPQSLLAKQNNPRAVEPATEAAPAPTDRNQYDVVCNSCQVVFDATEADWCSCLTRDRTVVCTNCLTCFCKAAPAYKETFWLEAPPRIFERRAAENRRQHLAVTPNLPPAEVKHPLVMLVEDDEEIQAVMQRVCANLGYGSVSAGDGQEGLELAVAYRPNLILADAFLPKLDGREMCRLLKLEPAFAATRMVVMTGLYTDSQFKNEAIKRFRIDDFLTKPVSITDLINLLQRHLEGAMFLPAQENLQELHRKEFDAGAEHGESTYEVACSSCGDMFDAVKAAWCEDSDSTLLCEHCGNCFCKATQYRQRFWANAPAVLFERKMIVAERDRGVVNTSRSNIKRPSIALLENDEATQLLVKTIAETLGYGFIAGGNAEEAQALAGEYRPDLVLADAWMPNRDGREVCRQLKKDPAMAGVKTIVMTGRYADQTYREEAQSQFNIDDFIAKPLAAGDLLQLIRKHLPQEVQAK